MTGRQLRIRTAVRSTALMTAVLGIYLLAHAIPELIVKAVGL